MIHALRSGSARPPARVTRWPGIAFPIPFQEWRGRIYRGLFFGAHGVREGSPIWSGVVRGSTYDHVDYKSTMIASNADSLRHFIATGELPPRVEDAFGCWLHERLAQGTRSLDMIPLEIHAIADPAAYQAAVKAYQSASAPF